MHGSGASNRQFEIEPFGGSAGSVDADGRRKWTISDRPVARTPSSDSRRSSVIGCGPVGLLAIMCAKLFGPAQIFAVDLVDYRLKKAEELGAIPLKADDAGQMKQIKEKTNGQGVDVALEAVGSAATLKAGIDSVRAGGRISAVGVFTDPVFNFPVSVAFMKGLTLSVSVCNARAYMPKLLPLVQRKALEPSKIISHRMPLSKTAEAYKIFDQHQEQAIKVLLQP